MITVTLKAVISHNNESLDKPGFLPFQILAVHLVHQGTPLSRRFAPGIVKFSAFYAIFFTSEIFYVIVAVGQFHGVEGGDHVGWWDVEFARDGEMRGDWFPASTVFMIRQHRNMVGGGVRGALVTQEGRTGGNFSVVVPVEI